MKTYCVTTPSMCGEIKVNEYGVITRAFPAYRGFIGKKLSRLEGWVKLHNGTLEEIKDAQVLPL